MRILMLGWEFPPVIAGGLGTACHGLTRALDRMGHSVCFVLPDPRGAGLASKRAGFRHAEFVGVPAGFTEPYSHGQGISPGTRYGHDLISESQRYASQVVAAASVREFDIVHAHDWLTFPAGLAVARMSGRPLVAHIHSTEADRSGNEGSGAVGFAAAEIERMAIHAADRVIAVSSVTRLACIERYDADPGRIEAIHNGTDVRARAPAPERRAGAGERVVLFLGRVTAQKGPALFLQAARRLLEIAPSAIGPIRFVMAGDGDKLATMRRLAVEWGITERVAFPGFLTGAAVGRAFANADVFVMTSLAEPFGLAAAEAVRHGVPVILPPWAGVAEVLPGVATCRPDDADGLASRILGIVGDPSGAAANVRSAQVDLRPYIWSRAAQACVSAYEHLARDVVAASAQSQMSEKV